DRSPPEEEPGSTEDANIRPLEELDDALLDVELALDELEAALAQRADKNTQVSVNPKHNLLMC
ncbi:MAG TPA: hypothetical protein PK129_02265, partial [Cellvibrionaceae bacterium]|nr:hypothetical protein [Cellvibrionaceae bacterium]